jgi:hypothetical protein
MKVIDGVEEDRTRGISLELELNFFGGEEELGVAKVLDARGIGRNIPNPFLYLVETVGLQEVVQVLLTLIAGAGGLPILDLTGLAVGEDVAVAGEEMLRIVGVILVVNSGVKNPVESARELLVSKTDKLPEGGREMGKENIERKVAGVLNPAEIEMRDVFKNRDFRP